MIFDILNLSSFFQYSLREDRLILWGNLKAYDSANMKVYVPVQVVRIPMDTIDEISTVSEKLEYLEACEH